MPDLPAKSSDGPGTPGVPARRVSSEELEAVIRRATELQFARGEAEEGLPEAEVMRIGKELGLEPAHVRRAISEVRGQPREEKGMMVSLMGPETIRAVRTIRRPAAQLGMELEEYLLKCEYMTVQRRFPDRTRYVRDNSVGASLGRVGVRCRSASPRSTFTWWTSTCRPWTRTPPCWSSRCRSAPHGRGSRWAAW